MNHLPEEAFVLLGQLATWRENGYPAPGGKISTRLIMPLNPDITYGLIELGLIRPETEMSANIEPVLLVVGYSLTERGNAVLAKNGNLN